MLSLYLPCRFGASTNTESEVKEHSASLISSESTNQRTAMNQNTLRTTTTITEIKGGEDLVAPKCAAKSLINSENRFDSRTANGTHSNFLLEQFSTFLTGNVVSAGQESHIFVFFHTNYALCQHRVHSS